MLWSLKNYFLQLFLMLLLFSVGLQRLKTMYFQVRTKFCVELWSTEVVFYTKVLVNDVLVGLKRILD